MKEISQACIAEYYKIIQDIDMLLLTDYFCCNNS